MRKYNFSRSFQVCGGGVLVETLVRETRGHSAWSRATHILLEEQFGLVQIYFLTYF